MVHALPSSQSSGRRPAHAGGIPTSQFSPDAPGPPLPHAVGQSMSRVVRGAGRAAAVEALPDGVTIGFQLQTAEQVPHEIGATVGARHGPAVGRESGRRRACPAGSPCRRSRPCRRRRCRTSASSRCRDRRRRDWRRPGNSRRTASLLESPRGCSVTVQSLPCGVSRGAGDVVVARQRAGAGIARRDRGVAGLVRIDAPVAAARVGFGMPPSAFPGRRRRCTRRRRSRGARKRSGARPAWIVIGPP